MNLPIKEQKILEKVDVINGTLKMGRDKGLIDPLFYEQCRLYLNELHKALTDKFGGDVR